MRIANIALITSLKFKKHAENKCNAAQEKQRNIREIFCRMQPAKNFEKFSIGSGGIGIRL